MMVKQVDILILGAGWTSTFLIPLLKKSGLTYAATTTTGRDGTYKFKFASSSPSSLSELDQYSALPHAKTILITFPLTGPGSSTRLVSSYTKTHEEEYQSSYQWIQLGSTGIWQISNQDLWVDRSSRYEETNARAVAEDELLGLGGCVLDLAGLWGGARDPKHWIDRVAGTKEALSGKTSLHMVHGEDVARGIVGVHGKFEEAKGERFMLTDMNVYDWWALILDYGGRLDVENGNDERAKKQCTWVLELMNEKDVKALPRSIEQLGRAYDTREFWTTFEVVPIHARV